MNETYIEFKNITKRFDAVTALDNISLSIPQGCFMTLLGPSGCGKTTLMRQLAGFSEPDSGDIYLNGRRVNGLPPYKRGTPLVFQEYALFPHMTVYENISYGLRLKKTERPNLDESVKKMLETFNLKGMESRFPRQLSGGQQQRVAFARALIMGQEVLLLDEPLSNLDAKLRVEVREELKQIQRNLGITVIYVTHDQDEALSMSDQIAVMKLGRIMQVGSPWEIYFRPANLFVADFVGAVNLLPVTVSGVIADGLEVSWQDQRITVPGARGFSPGEAALLMLRPESIMIRISGAAPPDTAMRGGKITGKVVFSSFLGRYIRYWVKCAERDGKELTLIIDDANPGIDGPVSGQVELTFDTRKLHVLKAETQGAVL
ncbi:MAG: ABC transporter ATP-binding protein [Spirochaetaceae bacterium]|nr:ABC transporter ATP-binding protein [Spirochaetaceae bacterium]